jgi:predicted RNA-binding Zn-ribbon protein involved in translation (DUF1610 family)
MNCTNCGKENDGTNSYCWNCGSKLGDSEVPNNKSTFITLSCPSCGGKLKITQDMDRFACGFCGNEHIVRRSGGTVSLTPVVEGLRKVQSGVDKTASELAIVRLKQEIEELEEECCDLEDNLDKKKKNWNSILIGLTLVVLVTLFARNIFLAGFLTLLDVGVLVARLKVRDNGQLGQAEKLLEKRESELKQHEKIVRLSL